MKTVIKIFFLVNTFGIISFFNVYSSENIKIGNLLLRGSDGDKAGVFSQGLDGLTHIESEFSFFTGLNRIYIESKIFELGIIKDNNDYYLNSNIILGTIAVLGGFTTIESNPYISVLNAPTWASIPLLLHSLVNSSLLVSVNQYLDLELGLSNAIGIGKYIKFYSSVRSEFTININKISTLVGCDYEMIEKRLRINMGLFGRPNKRLLLKAGNHSSQP
jgi:hypothetical protein